MPKIDQNGPDFYYRIRYRRQDARSWSEVRIVDPTQSEVGESNMSNMYYDDHLLLNQNALWECVLFPIRQLIGLSMKRIAYIKYNRIQRSINSWTTVMIWIFVLIYFQLQYTVQDLETYIPFEIMVTAYNDDGESRSPTYVILGWSGEGSKY